MDQAKMEAGKRMESRDFHLLRELSWDRGQAEAVLNKTKHERNVKVELVDFMEIVAATKSGL